MLFFCRRLPILLLLLTACGSEKSLRTHTPSSSADQSAGDTEHTARLDAAAKLSLSEAVSHMAATDIEWEDAWAFAHCDCAHGLAMRYLVGLGETRGALPEVLVPQIRREIRSDAMLSTILKFASGAFRNAVEWFVGRVLGDEGLAERIRTGLMEKIKRALGMAADAEAPDLEQSANFRFDLFPTKKDPLAPIPTAFSARDQAARAAWIFALPDTWSGARHGTHLLETARVMAEWRYIIGDIDSSTGKMDGGLLFNPKAGLASSLTPLDQSASAAAVGSYSGDYAVTFHQGDALDIALNVDEAWTRKVAAIALDEQAVLADAAARAFHRLKPSARAAVLSLFDADSGLFPGNAHALPLVFLASVSRLLSDGFIDQDTRSVRQYAVLAGMPDAPASEPATLKSLTRTLRALTAWYAELQNIAATDIPSEAGDSLDGAAAQLLRGSQLLTSVILRDFSDQAQDAETIAALAEANKIMFNSAFLSDKLAAIAPKLGLSPDTPRALAWTLTAVRALRQDAGTRDLLWLAEAEAELSAVMEAPDAR